MDDNQVMKNVYLTRLRAFVHEDKRLAREYDEAWKDFPRFSDNGIQEEALLEDWFIFDHKLGGMDITPLEYFISLHLDLPAEERWIYECFKQNVYSIFEVKAVKIGKEMILRDLVTDKEYWVWEKTGTRQIRKGQTIFGRAVAFEDHYILSGVSHGYPEEALYGMRLCMKNIRDRKADLRLDPRYMAKIFSDFINKISPDRMELDELEKKIREKLEEAGLSDTTFVDVLDKFNKADYCVDIIDDIMRKAVFQSHHDADYLVELLHALWNKMPHESMGGLSPEDRQKSFIRGHQEQSLLRQMTGFLQKMVEPHLYRDTDSINEAIAKAQDKWLDAKNAELDGKSPREVILEERRRLGNKEEKIMIQIFARPLNIVTREQKEVVELYNAARTLMREKRYEEAIEKYERYTKICDQNYVVWGNMGVANTMLGNRKEALKCLHRALSLKPDYKIAKNNLRRLENGAKRLKRSRPGR